MTLWIFILIIFGFFLTFGFVVDYIAKKKNTHLDPEEGLKNASESERIYKEQHLKQSIDKFNNPDL